MRHSTARITFSLIGLICISVAQATAPQGVLIGHAIDLETGESRYIEEHRFFEKEGRQVMRTRYRTADNIDIASREVLYDNQRVASYQLNMHNIAYEEAVDRKDGEILIRVNAEQSVQKSLPVDSDREIVIDAGFNEYILRNWASLIDGEKAIFDFASTAQLDIVRLQVTADEKLSTDQIQMFSMTAANPIIRLLMKPIKAGYFKDSKQLAYYRGISNLKDDSGDAYKVEISFANKQLVQITIDD